MIPAMKTDTLTKSLLAIIAVALVFIAGRGALNHETPVQAPSTGPTYEYKLIVRTFAVDWNNLQVTENSTWTEDGKTPPDRTNNSGGLGSRIHYLGSQGGNS